MTGQARTACTAMITQPVMLVIFDGFGVNPSRAFNGWALARTPHLDHYFASHPHTTLQASGPAVGLPDGQFGSSEVGHLTLGAGRVLRQDIVRVSDAIRSGAIARTPAWQSLSSGAHRIHLVGLVSSGGVHAHIDHLLGLLDLLSRAQLEPIVHFIADGRDTPPRSAPRFAEQLQAALTRLHAGFVGSLTGRYYAMDRAGHYERTQQAWNTMVKAAGLHADTAAAAIAAAYDRGETDEFIQPTVVGDPDASRMRAEDAVLFFNFRSDRMRQIASAVGLAHFDGFDRGTEGPRRVVTMTSYESTFPFPVLVPPESVARGLAQTVADAGLRQFHCAETEKYPHVTYFFNGGAEAPFAGEERAIVASPKVPTYDLQPEMSASGVADRVIAEIERDRHAFILVNLANGDMVGHTARIPAIIRAVETLDLQFHRMARAARAHGTIVILTADHGNCDEMVDPVTGEPHTQHTVYPVPLLTVGQTAPLSIGGALSDVAPTVLHLMGLAQPAEMTGRSLILS